MSGHNTDKWITLNKFEPEWNKKSWMAVLRQFDDADWAIKW